MIRKWIAAGVCALLLAPLTGCGPKNETIAEDPTEVYAHTLGLTAEQRQEDFAVFERELRDGYPCWSLLDRKGVDVDAIFDEYREMVAQEDSDYSLLVAVNSALYRLGGEGHLSMVDPSYYAEFLDALATVSDRTTWYETLNNPVSRKNYPKMLEMWSDDAESGDTADSASAPPENVTAVIIEPDKIAYLKIDSFDGHIEADRAQVTAFLDQVRNYDHLIIDITQNGGGSDRYWMDLLAAPLANEPLSGTNIALVRHTEATAKYLAEEYPPEALHPISELPALPKLEAGDKALATHFIENTLTVTPTGEGFRGKIWLLVSEKVYSSAEAFTVFCKDTGFAEVVGTPTGGDGIGIDPILFSLPNSGILIRYSALYGLNPDGSGNEEYGTTPDLLSPASESPLVTALRAIRSADNR